jgi:hypothetical protein
MKLRSLLPLTAVLFLACRDERTESSARSPAASVGEDGRLDCQDSSIRPEEGAQWAFLKRGFRLPDLGHRSFPRGDFELRLLRREPSGLELLLLLRRESGRPSAQLIRPETSLRAEFLKASERTGALVPDLWDPHAKLDSFALPDSFAKRAVSLVESKGIPSLLSTRRCDTAAKEASPLGEAIYVVDAKDASLHRTAILRPGHYAEGFWNALQALLDAPLVKDPGPGF